MKTLVCLLLSMTVAIVAKAQDFATRFREECKSTALQCVTVGPKMMEAAVANAGHKGENAEDINHIMSQLTSMQVITATKNRKAFFAKAQTLLKRNDNRFELYRVLTERNKRSQINIRKQEGKVVELVLLTLTSKEFTLINFTGDMDTGSMQSLSRIMTKHS